MQLLQVLLLDGVQLLHTMGHCENVWIGSVAKHTRTAIVVSVDLCIVRDYISLVEIMAEHRT